MRLIDADALMVATLNFCNGYKVNWTDRKVLSWINHAPTIDAVPVVRCEKCKHNNERHALTDGGVWCEYWGTDPDNDDFCSHGERRSDV